MAIGLATTTGTIWTAATRRPIIHFAAVETKSHWFLHYNFFHPATTPAIVSSELATKSTTRASFSLFARTAASSARWTLMETLAHNNIDSYAKIDIHDGHHPTVFPEAGGPGAALAVGARNSTISALRKDFISGTGVTLL